MGDLGWRAGTVHGQARGAQVRVAIGSAFRNSAGGHLQRYFHQVDALRDLLKEHGHSLRVIAVEGDSVDNTRTELMRWAEYCVLALTIVTRNHGKRVFGSTEEPERMAALSYVGNGILESVLPEDDVLIYVESDLVWRAETMLSLINKLGFPEVQPMGGEVRTIDAISPLVFAGEAFYDIWAFRKSGHRFGPFKPYHGELLFDRATPVDSTGSCIVMRGEVARTCRIIDNEALVGFGRDVWAKGFALFADARERIDHP